MISTTRDNAERIEPLPLEISEENNRWNKLALAEAATERERILDRRSTLPCPQCGSMESVVIDSRGTAKRSFVRRRRCCQGCGHRYTTYETYGPLRETDTELLDGVIGRVRDMLASLEAVRDAGK